MALSKEIELGNGVVTTYHRVVSVTNVTNEQTVVEVASYTSRRMREKEMDEMRLARQGAPEGEGPYEMDSDVFIHTDYHVMGYDESMTIENAYEAMKGLPQFADAADA